MEPSQDNKKEKQEEVYDLGNFSDFDEHDDQDACGGDNKHKSEKDPSKTATCKTDGNKTCPPECQNKPAEEKTIDPTRLCKKCKEQKGTLKYRSEPVCKGCYLSGMEHRFRSSLRTQVKLSKKDDEFLCCLSGGQNSLAMCHMISETLYNPSPRRMFFKSQIIHINEAAIANVSEEEEEENINKIKKLAEVSKLQTTIRNLEDIYDVQNEFLHNLLHQSYGITLTEEAKTDDAPKVLEKAEKREKLRKLINSLSDTGSSRDDLIFVFIKLLIVDFALKNKIQKIFFSDTAQKVAINSLSLLCKGRGADIFNQVVSEEKIFSGVTIYRPMNDFLTKEILVFDHFNKLDQFLIIYPKLEDLVPSNKKYPGNGSINTLLENFVDKLQAGFPSTVHTVLNTLTKIKPKNDEKRICPICWGRKDKLGNILEKGSIIQYLKPQGAVKEEVQENKETTFDMSFASKKIKEEYLNSDYFKAKDSLEKVACFSCGRIFENAKDQKTMGENLPGFIRGNADSLYGKIVPKEVNQEAFDYYFYDDEQDL